MSAGCGPLGALTVNVAVRASRSIATVTCEYRSASGSMTRSIGVSATPFAVAGRSLVAASASARSATLAANCAGLAIASTSRQSMAFCPRTPSLVVQKTSARSWRTWRLSVRPRQPAGAWQHAQERHLRQADRAAAVIDENDLITGEREFVAAAGARAIHRGEEFHPSRLEESSRPLRVSLVNLQKFTFHAWLETPSMKMLAPEQNTRLSRAGDDHGAHFRVLETDAVYGVVEFDVDAQVVAIELELVAGPQAGVLVKICKRGSLPARQSAASSACSTPASVW